MQIGIDSFVAINPEAQKDASTEAATRIEQVLEEMVLADQVGLDTFGIGEHHRKEYLDSAPAIILAAAAARTSNIRLASAVTVLSAADPVRVFQEFATLDLLSRGRAEMVLGRGSFTEAFPLFGFDVRDYDSLFAEKLELLLQIREKASITWSGRHRPALVDQGIYPRPLQDPIPMWVGVGGTPASFVRAGTLGLPLMLAIIGGEPHRFRPLVEMYREAGKRAGHPPEKLKVGLHMIGFIGQTSQQARDDFFPGYARAFDKIGLERGWPPTTRSHFEAQCGPTGALMIGDAEYVAGKISRVDKVLGGINRLNFQMTVATLPHEKMLQSIEMLGKQLAPLVRAGSTS